MRAARSPSFRRRGWSVLVGTGIASWSSHDHSFTTVQVRRRTHARQARDARGPNLSSRGARKRCEERDLRSRRARSRNATVASFYPKEREPRQDRHRRGPRRADEAGGAHQPGAQERRFVAAHARRDCEQSFLVTASRRAHGRHSGACSTVRKLSGAHLPAPARATCHRAVLPIGMGTNCYLVFGAGGFAGSTTSPRASTARMMALKLVLPAMTMSRL